jgi:hypothetical protein
MSDKTVKIRLAPATQEQIAALAKFGGTSDVIAVAVDRLWQAEKPPNDSASCLEARRLDASKLKR